MCKNIKASEFEIKGYNCAESIVKAYNEEFGTNIPVRLVTGFGGGLCVGSVCGAINSSILVLGYEKGRDSENEEKQIKPYVEEFMRNINEKYQHHLCKVIKVDKKTCREIIDFSYKTLKDILEK